MSARTFWIVVLALWIVLFALEINRGSASIVLDALPHSLGMLTGCLMPGFLLWGLARAFGAYKEPSQRRAMVLVGAVITVVLMVVGMSSH
ncbi:MAG: hypothetical protein K2X00_02175 [Nitrospiraceae bacterium]|nr:hypothetical protein [Nitrospiraceae bacterium]OQW63995.1 MAG: hypothetical protein BVN29_14330 [Nitrospira sp. ST-bin5]